MTAFIVPQELLGAAQAVVGDQFSVSLSPDGAEPATHLGCNWVDCPEEIVSALAQVDGVALGDNWAQLLDQVGLRTLIAVEDQEAGEIEI